jgi:hypothetical protein
MAATVREAVRELLEHTMATMDTLLAASDHEVANIPRRPGARESWPRRARRTRANKPSGACAHWRRRCWISAAGCPTAAFRSSTMDCFPRGVHRAYFKSLYLNGLDDRMIAEIAPRAADRPSDLTLCSVWYLGGAVAELKPQIQYSCRSAQPCRGTRGDGSGEAHQHYALHRRCEDRAQNLAITRGAITRRASPRGCNASLPRECAPARSS